MIANIWYERSFAGEKRVAGIFSYTCLSLILTRLHHGFMSLRRVSKRLRVQDENAGITASTGVPNRKSDTTPQIQVYLLLSPSGIFPSPCTGAERAREFNGGWYVLHWREQVKNIGTNYECTTRKSSCLVHTVSPICSNRR